MAQQQQKKTAQPAAAAGTVLPPTVGGRVSLLTKLAAKYSVDPVKMNATLKATAFKTGKNDPEVTDEQMLALLVVADQYNLNPFTKDIFAFPDTQKGGITPIVSVDGWLRMINEHPQFESMSITYPETEPGEIPEWCEVGIVRKDRPSTPPIREYYAECKRDTGPWRGHPRRMLRHKAIIQAGRVVMGFSGIHDPDEAERIRDAIDVTPERQLAKAGTAPPKAIENQPTALLDNDQLFRVRQALDKSGLIENEFLEQFQVHTFEELRFEQLQPALDWITRNSP